jgi:hypothetical protein
MSPNVLDKLRARAAALNAPSNAAASSAPERQAASAPPPTRSWPEAAPLSAGR